MAPNTEAEEDDKEDVEDEDEEEDVGRPAVAAVTESSAEASEEVSDDGVCGALRADEEDEEVVDRELGREEMRMPPRLLPLPPLPGRWLLVVAEEGPAMSDTEKEPLPLEGAEEACRCDILFETWFCCCCRLSGGEWAASDDKAVAAADMADEECTPTPTPADCALALAPALAPALEGRECSGDAVGEVAADDAPDPLPPPLPPELRLSAAAEMTSTCGRADTTAADALPLALEPKPEPPILAAAPVGDGIAAALTTRAELSE